MRQEDQPFRWRLPLVLAIVGAVGLLIVGGRHLAETVPRFAHWAQGLGGWGPAVFIAGYAVATVLFVPGLLLTLAAGAIFGVARGTLYTMLGATLGASLAFLLARTVARRAIERRIAGNRRFAAIDRAVGVEGFKIVALLRLSPVVPFNLLNYSLGLTRVNFRVYLAACVAMLPGSLLYVSYGAAAGSLAGALSQGGSRKGPVYWTLLAVGLTVTLAVTVFVSRLAGRALRTEIGEADAAPAGAGETHA